MKALLLESLLKLKLEIKTFFGQTCNECDVEKRGNMFAYGSHENPNKPYKYHKKHI